VLIGTGLRKGEALGLHWADIDLDQRVLFVRYTLSNINNTTPVFTAPKTKTSLAWVGLSTRVVAALHHQAARQRHQRLHAATPYADLGLVFTRANGQPYDPSTCCTASTNSPPRRDSPASACTTCGTSQPH
jgi:integrase